MYLVVQVPRAQDAPKRPYRLFGRRPAIASAVRSNDGHMVGIALCYVQDDVSAKEFQRLLSLLLACCEDIGAKFSDSFWTTARPG